MDGSRDKLRVEGRENSRADGGCLMDLGLNPLAAGKTRAVVREYEKNI